MPNSEPYGTDTNDIIIVGAGVAGLTAAIMAAKAGLRPIVLERRRCPAARPGETFHPGIEPLLEKLGVAGDIPSIATARPLGIKVKTPGATVKVGYGGTPDAPWRGFQVRREALCNVLRDRAEALGANIVLGQSAGSILRNDGQGVVVRTKHGDIPSQWIIDATGPYGWSARHDRSGYRRASPDRFVCFGYQPTSDPEDINWPIFSPETWGWSYKAVLGDGQTAWVNLYNSRSLLKSHRPPECGVADGTWRISHQPARNRLYRIGDAAFTLDPSSGKGVLRAMMSAIMAIHQISTVVQENMCREKASELYSDWMSSWFEHETSDLEEASRFQG